MDSDSVPDIQITVPKRGLIGESETLIRLRTIASDVGCTSYELEDDQGDLSIVLHFPSSGVDESTDVARLFAVLAGFQHSLVRVLDE